jgi:replicative DNA helicase
MNRNINLMVEARLLGNIIKQPEVWREIAPDFRAELFSDPEYQTIAEIIIDLTEGGQRPSSVKIYNEMHKRKVSVTVDDLLDVIMGHVTTKETKSLLFELEDLFKRRVVYQTLLNALNKLQQDDKATDQLIAEAQQAMIDAFDKTGKSDVKSMHDVAEKLFLRQERIQSGEQLPVYPLNLQGVQDLVGGLESGSITILAARPSMGKTSYMLSECVGWAQRGLPGLIFSLEQEDVQIGQRNIASLETMPVSYLRRMLDKENLDKFYSGLSKLRELPIRISDRRGLTADQICSIARLEKMRNPNMKWVAVDYLTAMNIDDRQYYLQVGQAVKKLRDLAKEIDVFVVLLAQLNRGVETRNDKRPLMSDLRDSGNIEEFADVILFLYREGYYDPGFLGSDMGDWITEIEVAKNRQGGNAGKYTLAMFKQPYMQWIDCPGDWATKYSDATKGRKE